MNHTNPTPTTPTTEAARLVLWTYCGALRVENFLEQFGRKEATLVFTLPEIRGTTLLIIDFIISLCYPRLRNARRIATKCECDNK
jgi:hypothetical protein